jgi:hypothetical protein
MYEQLTHYINSHIKVTEEELKTILPFFKSLKLKKNELLVTH